ncbi:MAG: hypothetical protein CVU42_09660 [Chloroflexi bacterium HGW-Chloroflexi-4]|jgi:uncharacterized protein (TIGR02246 family)|nr:MAG: hypothetical protein CVU42_09660 [Chloroflexi bacterium HGW-Chloroflexi-4]
MKETIFSLENAAMERWRQGDPFGWTDISADDVIYIEPNLVKPIIGLEDYQTYFKPAIGQIIYQGSEFIDPEIVVVGDAAVLSYNYRSTVNSADGAILSQLYWNATEVYFKRDQQWKIVHTHWSYAPHKMPENVEVPIPLQMPPRQYEGVLGELMALESAAMERWRKGDPDGFMAIYAPEVTYFDSGTLKRIDGWDALKKEYDSRAGKIHYDVMDFIDPQVRVLGDMAVLTYRFFDLHINSNGSVANRTPWNCSEVYIKQEGQWKIIHSHWSLIKGQKN